MIEPMKKISLVVMESQREAALVELRRLGLLHLIHRPASSASLISLLDTKAKLETGIGIVRNYEPKKDTKGKKAKIVGDGLELLNRVLSLAEARKAEQEAIYSDVKEKNRVEPWGDFDPHAFIALSQGGLSLNPYELPKQAYEKLPESIRVIVVGTTKTTVRCVAVGAQIPDQSPFGLPEKSLSDIKKAIGEHKKNIEKIDQTLTNLAPQGPILEGTLRKIERDMEFETAKVSMERDDDLTEGRGLCWLTGFVPADSAGIVKRGAAEHGWALIVDDPDLDEPVPTKLKNHPVVAMVQPIFDFLGTIPNYREYDISAWFLLFFCFFFAMIFGDAVYGLFLFGAGALVALLSKRKGKPVPVVARLLMTLSVFTIIWGVMTLTYLGIDADKLPSFLKVLSIHGIASDNPNSGDNIKVICFILGTVQLSLAHIKNIRRDRATLKWLGQFGQFLMMLGMINVVFNLVINAQRFPVPNFSLYLLGGGFALSFVFSNYEGNIIRSILASLANFVSVFLGVVSNFADIVSYIRLWAVGLAGLAISQTLNSMLGPMLGKASLFLIGLLSLIIGHLFNITLGFLSVIVHGIRLNMLEFSVHLGMEWSGFEYHPFKERNENNDKTSKE
jgi:V/A-type H+-transporting ATPase subunit I